MEDNYQPLCPKSTWGRDAAIHCFINEWVVFASYIHLMNNPSDFFLLLVLASASGFRYRVLYENSTLF